MEIVFSCEDEIAFHMMCLHLKVWRKLHVGFLSEYLPECHMKVVRQDITNLECECIVNSANTNLAVGDGLNGAIHRAAGSALQEECQRLNGCQIGEAKITSGYQLKTKYVIHTIGPVHGTPDAEEMLKKCYYNCLEVARENDIHSIAFPMISTEKFAFPKAAAAKIAFTSVHDWQKQNYCYHMEIVFCCFETDSFDFISRYLHNWKCNDENRRSETQGLVFHCQKLQFYPEDEKLMAEMSVRERIEYRRKLKEIKNILFWMRSKLMKTKSIIMMGRLIIPSGTEQICPRAYEGNMRIRSVTVPGSVKTIGMRAFADCENLTSITLCEGIETIESNAFTDCTSLKSIQLPASIKQITGWAFYDSGLQKPVLSADGRILVCCPQAAAGTEYTVPKSVQEIGVQAFVGLHNLQRVILPEGLQVIRERAFIACGFESVSLPKSIKHIEAGAFYDCEKLKDITGLQKSDPVEYTDEFWRIQGKRLTMPCVTDQPQTRHWDESEFQSIARRCAEADASAMYQMKEYFHHKSLQYPDVIFYARAANFWLYRAYQYGNQEAKMFLAKWTDAHPGQRLRTVRLSNSLGGTLQGYLLNAMGFLDFEEEREYTLHCVDKEGLVLVDSYDSEDGPDEDGYGSEIYYDWWFVDDCLNFIPGAPLLHSYSSNDMRSKSAKQKLSDIHEQTVKLRKRKIVE